MSSIVKYITIVVLTALAMASCSNELSLQKYLVDKQADDNFLKVDLAASLLQGENGIVTDEQKEILNTIKKVNVVAYPIKNGDTDQYNTEKTKISDIVGQEKYKELGSFKSGKTKMNLKYLGDDDAIDEVIVMASDDERGFALFRLLGDDMKPGDMMKMFNTMQSGDFDVSKLAGIGDMFGDIDGLEELEESMKEELEESETRKLDTEEL